LVLTFLAPNSLPCADGAVKNLLTHCVGLCHAKSPSTHLELVVCCESYPANCIKALNKQPGLGWNVIWI